MKIRFNFFGWFNSDNSKKGKCYFLSAVLCNDRNDGVDQWRVGLLSALMILGTGFSSSSYAVDEATLSKKSVSEVRAASTNTRKSTTSTRPSGVSGKTSLKVKKNPVSVGYQNWTWINSQVMNTGEWDDATSLNHMSLDYTTSDKSKWSVRPQYELNWSDNEYDTEWADLYFQYSKGKVIEFSSSLSLSFTGRLYVPTSEGSKETGTVTTRGYIGLTKAFGYGLELSYLALPILYSNTKRVRTFEANDKGIMESHGTKGFYFYEEVRVLKNFKSYSLAPQFALGHDSMWKHSGVATNANEEFLVMEAALGWDPLKNLSLYLSVLQEKSMRRAKESFSPFRDSESTYHLILSTSI